MNPTLTWHPASQLPLPEQADCNLLLELESGYYASGEYETETAAYFANVERIPSEMKIPVATTPDFLNDNLEYELEEVRVLRWMWIPRE